MTERNLSPDEERPRELDVLVCDEAERQTYVTYLFWKTMSAFHEFFNEHSDEQMEWTECFDLFSESEHARETGEKVIRYALERLWREDIIFEDRNVVFFPDKQHPGIADDGAFEAVHIVPMKQGEDFIALLFGAVEYKYYDKKHGHESEYAWNAFLEDLQNDTDAFAMIIETARYELARLDLKSAWAELWDALDSGREKV